MTLTKKQFSVRRGVTLAAVSLWIARGILTGAALTADGGINVAQAERQLAARLSMRNRRAAMTQPSLEPNETAAPSPRPEEIADSPLARRALAVAAQAELDLQERQMRMKARMGIYVLAARVRANRGRTLARLVSAMENWLPDLCASLGGDAEMLATMRREWSRFRERQADAVLTEADELPELMGLSGISCGGWA